MKTFTKCAVTFVTMKTFTKQAVRFVTMKSFTKRAVTFVAIELRSDKNRSFNLQSYPFFSDLVTDQLPDDHMN